ncbi:hypothetical protein A2442_02650 [Candidatus Campbellbacteria bacterium RIFOXYC2_FULL_35_25]|uniref:Cytochrome c domain-containing protein n=1 Tax=Candidatus Campbellbacteria bacterium RIFOXYC2_FULL_35_25 TaxID=1797582 RepID=A0A1F5EI54_9BACT|nr:MAG: hypothetical protein A2442_02650 [Candidatus Campbellbacteria bacterium RIFOXYC2_FULL_35_25]
MQKKTLLVLMAMALSLSLALSAWGLGTVNDLKIAQCDTCHDGTVIGTPAIGGGSPIELLTQQSHESIIFLHVSPVAVSTGTAAVAASIQGTYVTKDVRLSDAQDYVMIATTLTALGVPDDSMRVAGLSNDGGFETIEQALSTGTEAPAPEVATPLKTETFGPLAILTPAATAGTACPLAG